MEYDFSIEEMIQRLAEFPPKALREKVTSEIGEMSFNYYHSTVKENIYNYVASLPDHEIRALFEKAA